MLKAKECELENLVGIIYLIQNRINGKRYIGQSVNTFYYRYTKKWWNYPTNEYFKRAINKYGPHNFEIKIILSNQTQNGLDFWETFYIDYFQSNNLKYGYNMVSGGGSPNKETRDKISNSLIITKDEFLKLARNKFGNDFIYNLDNYERGQSKIVMKHVICGTEFVQQANLHIIRNKIGCPKCARKIQDEKRSKSIVKIDENKNIILNFYNSLTEAAKQNKMAIQHIQKACQSGIHARGYRWEYYLVIKDFIINNNELKENYENFISKRKPVKFRWKRISRKLIDEIKQKYSFRKYTMKTLAKEYNVSESVVFLIIHNKINNREKI